MHLGRIVALDSPKALLASLGQEILELRLDGDARGALASLQSHGIAGDDAFVVGSTLTVPLHRTTTGSAVGEIERIGLRPIAISTRQPTLDDVYLRLTGDRLAEAA